MGKYALIEDDAQLKIQIVFSAEILTFEQQGGKQMTFVPELEKCGFPMRSVWPVVKKNVKTRKYCGPDLIQLYREAKGNKSSRVVVISLADACRAIEAMKQNHSTDGRAQFESRRRTFNRRLNEVESVSPPQSKPSPDKKEKYLALRESQLAQLQTIDCLIKDHGKFLTSVKESFDKQQCYFRDVID